MKIFDVLLFLELKLLLQIQKIEVIKILFKINMISIKIKTVVDFIFCGVSDC